MAAFDLHVPSSDEWMLARDLRLTALAAAPLAYLEKLSDAEARDEAGWREMTGETPIRRQLVARDADGTWIASTVVRAADERAWLVGVWVDPAHRGSGVLDALVRAQMEWARGTLGADRIYLHVGETNPRARGAYERLGFRATGVVETFPGHPEREHEMVAQL